MTSELNNSFFKQTIRDAYSNPGTQLGAQNKNFGAVSQTDLMRGYVSSAAQAKARGNKMCFLFIHKSRGNSCLQFSVNHSEVIFSDI